MNFKKKIKDYWSCIVIYLKELDLKKFFMLLFKKFVPCVIRKRKASKAKIEALVDKLCTWFQKAFYPLQNVCIDEMVIPHMGIWEYKQYNPKNIEECHECMKFVWWCSWLLLRCYICRYQNLLQLPCILLIIHRNISTSDKATAQRPPYFFVTTLKQHIQLSF